MNPARLLRSFFSALVSTFLVSLFIGFVLLFILGAYLLPRVFSRFQIVNTLFTDQSHRSAVSIGGELWAGYSLPAFTEKQRWLILGTDEVEGSNRPEVLTDTVMLATLDPQANQVRLLSFPRDIFVVPLKVKINGIYKQAQAQGNLQPELAVQTAVQDMIGQPIQSTIIIRLQDIADVIDIVGGIQVDVANAFTDTQFPKSGVDVTKVHDPKLLYETVHFDAGLQTMGGQTALKFIRSRKATEIVEAGDGARARRQQQVITALAQRLQSPDVIGNPTTLGKLFDWYSRHTEGAVPLTELGQLAKTILSKNNFPQMQSLTLPVTEAAKATDSATLYVHPPESKYYGEWVYEPTDATNNKLKKFIQDQGL